LVGAFNLVAGCQIFADLLSLMERTRAMMTRCGGKCIIAPGGQAMKADKATAEVFFTAYKALKGGEREAFLEKVVRNRRLREELIDIALIEQAKTVKGRAVSAKDYFSRRRGEG
jgi:hypothetical protein